MELELTLVGHDGVAGVVAAGEAHDSLSIAGEEVYDLPLALVAPLTAYDRVCRHTAPRWQRKNCAPGLSPSVGAYGCSIP